MKCQNCGNELGQDEVFCGQCGAPNATPAQQTEMMQVPQSGLLNDAYRKRTGAVSSHPSNPAYSPESMPDPQQSAIRQPQSQQNGGFHQDATEAISFVPGTPPNYQPPAYPPQPGYTGNSLAGAGGFVGSGQFGNQPQSQQFMTGNYSNPSFPPTQMGLSGGQFTQGGGYGTVPGFGMPPTAPKRGNVVMLIGIVCLVFAIITVGVFGAIFAVRGNNQGQPTPVAQASVTPTPSPSPSPTPTIAVTPTPAPDANFLWCSALCTQKGFLIEVYQGWGSQDTTNEPGVQFSSSDPTTYAAVKLPTGSTSPTDLLNNDLQEIAAQSNATPTGPLAPCASNQPIGGSSWTCETATLQPTDTTQAPIQVMLYATIYQGKAYVIDLVAPQSTFTYAQQIYFTPMLNSYQFVTPTL